MVNVLLYLASHTAFPPTLLCVCWAVIAFVLLFLRTLRHKRVRIDQSHDVTNSVLTRCAPNNEGNSNAGKQHDRDGGKSLRTLQLVNHALSLISIVHCGIEPP